MLTIQAAASRPAASTITRSSAASSSRLGARARPTFATGFNNLIFGRSQSVDESSAVHVVMYFVSSETMRCRFC